MEFKRYLGILFVFIVIMFILMMFTSYAYYSFSNAKTVFNSKTTSDVISIDYSSGKYINISNGIPVLCDDINDSSEVGRNNFSVNVTGEANTRDIAVSVKLIDISIDDDLRNENFKYELIYNNRVVSDGNFKNFSGEELVISDNVLLDGGKNNDFELRVFILDNDKSQNDMMNKSFIGTISVNVVSRNDSASDFKISSIYVDGVKSDSIPVSGEYNVASNKCGKYISWDNDSRTISIVGSLNGFVKDCDLEFTSTGDKKVLLSSVAKSGDYVTYSSDKGVVSCPNGSDRKFVSSGYRVAYVDMDYVYLVSSGASSCVATNKAGNIGNSDFDSFDTSSGLVNHINNLNSVVVSNYCNSDYVYSNRCNSSSVWALNDKDFNKMLENDNTVSKCYHVSSNMDCGYNNNLIDNGGYYWIVSSNSDNKLYYWDALRRYVDMDSSNHAYGVRAIIKLDRSVYVTGGNGTKKNAYKISI